MTQYKTKAATIGDITVTVSKAQGSSAAEKLEAFLKWLSDKLVDPDYGVGEGGRPDQGLPGSGGRPDNSLPGQGGRPDQGLPSGGGRPDNTLPGGGQGSTKPTPPSGGTKPVDPDEGHVDNTLPGGGGQVDNGLPGFIGENAKEIAKAILKGTLCDPDKPQPK